MAIVQILLSPAQKRMRRAIRLARSAARFSRPSRTSWGGVRTYHGTSTSSGPNVELPIRPPTARRNIAVGLSVLAITSGTLYFFNSKRDLLSPPHHPTIKGMSDTAVSRNTKADGILAPTTKTQLYTELDAPPTCRNVRNQECEGTLQLSEEEVSRILRKNEYSFRLTRGNGVVRYDRVQVPSNDPVEDDYSEKLLQAPSTSASSNADWMFWGIYNGHG